MVQEVLKLVQVIPSYAIFSMAVRAQLKSKFNVTVHLHVYSTEQYAMYW